ncbi:Uncharacterized conserved protein YafD, endonuclease/exonuclease/phosphatase (EEP) superfamily [Marinobacter daqiaonensis]|uniref:Uncharacterized conserved protein YafD, endonuclease/exonuclease/phosphatase (EEP) superfamily n=1 Tax=Marinobacter daqiaonensis TaxID=650891 RepID=A0A1I6GZG8_9GAMM|nr:endonuclease/exonuclease/phosphatase family protein [Marinobacter daqiaonensis]SFR47582.1 Uncharacterized conserved protein YafD, endonuclease/exonuclease/phosphatase (EEP) superfamily [Marinobacter daqiaonensis]
MTHDSGNVHQRSVKHKVGFGFVFSLVLLFATLSFVPLIDTNRWWVRILDFPRLQEAVALLILALPVMLYFRYFRNMAALAMILIFSALAYHGFVLFPYFQSGKDFPVAECRPGSTMSVMIANVKMRNDPDGRLLDLVRQVEPDLFLAMETNEKWNEALSPLEETMPHSVSHVSDSSFGIHLFSRLSLESPKIRFLAGQDTPQIVTGVRLASGETVDFLGVHPRPPTPRQSNTTLGRDAVLFKAALLLRESERTGIVAGDFNATPWESAVKRMRQIGYLEEPRRGHGYLPTFSANSVWMSWPLDHIFHEPGFATLSLERLPSFGSDHYPFLGKFCRISGHDARPPPQTDRELIKEAKRAIEAAKNSG